MAEKLLQHVRIVLVEPAGPLNVGSIARVMKNMGLSRLVLVNPLCDPHGPEARQMAVHAADILETVTIVPNLTEALLGCHRSIATTGRDRALPTDLLTPREGLPWLISEVPIESALIFGPEDRGLSNDELKYAQRFLRIPSSANYPSLNLAQAVAVCAYELYQWAIAQPHSQTNQPVNLSSSQPEVSSEELEGYYNQLETLLLRIGYLYPHTATSRMEKFRRIFNRAALSKTELAMLRGIFSQVEWALNQKHDE